MSGAPPALDRTVVVTGASGLIGRHLCADLTRRGYPVRALVRNPASLVAASGMQVARLDLPQVMDESLLEDAWAVVHCAYATRESDYVKARGVNEEGTRRVLEASRRAGVRRFVFLSSLVAHPEAPSYYARSKYELEGLMEPERDLVLRPGLVLAREGHGLFQQMQLAIRRAHVIPVTRGGRQPLQTIHVDDLCEGLVRALERDLTGVLRLAEAKPRPMREFLHLIAERLGVRCVRLPVPFMPLLAAARTAEALHLPFPLSSESLLGLMALRAVPVEEDLRRLELAPRTALESLEDLLEPVS